MPRVALRLIPQTVAGLLPLCLMPVVACAGRAGEPLTCDSQADCADGSRCVDGQCVANIVRDSGTTRSDAGFRFDAGTDRRDAGAVASVTDAEASSIATPHSAAGRTRRCSHERETYRSLAPTWAGST